jgi:hypothetical protein
VSGEEQSKRFRIDPSIRIGDLLSSAVIATTVAGAWFTLSGRVDRIEDVQRVRDASQDAAMVEFKGAVRDNIVQIRTDVQETRQDVKELSRFVRQKGM